MVYVLKKWCSGCSKYKELTVENFSRLDKKYSKDGFSYRCKVCDNALKREWYKKNKPREQIKRRKWQDEHHDEHLKHVKDYYARKKEKETV